MKEQIIRSRRFKIWKSIVTALSCVVVFCTTYALILPAITMENQAYCGVEEHAHEEECYSLQLICEFTDEAIEEHVHTEACYQSVFACEKDEHEHEKICYSDHSADVETAQDWESTLPQLTGDCSVDLIAVAESQLGYKESERNYIIEDNETIKGYSRYGEWYGEPYRDWNSLFVSFCLEYAGIDEEIMPQAPDCQEWINQLAGMGEGVFCYAEAYEANPGDLVFFDMDNDGRSDRMAIVVESGNEIKVIEGDKDNEVVSLRYDINDAAIIGYGLLQRETEAPVEEIIEEKTGEEIEEEIEEDSVDATEMIEEADKLIKYASRNLTRSSSVELTGNWSADVVAVAAAEKGYVPNNDGTSKYGEWYGDAAGNMSVLFPLWCLEQAQVDKEVVSIPEKTYPVVTPDLSTWVAD